MAGKSFLRNIAGRITEILGVQASAGAGNAGDIVALDAAGKLDATMMPVGVVADTKAIVASEALVDGDFVNIWDDAGTIKVRKADADAVGKEADGFVLAGYAGAAVATVYFEGTNNHLAGLTKGARYYLSTAAGGVTDDVSAYSGGKLVQYLGRAVSATEITFEPTDGIVTV